MNNVLDKIIKEIQDVEETKRQISDERWQQKIKGYKPSTAETIERRLDDTNRDSYLKGLLVAKAFIESEMNK